MTTTPFFGRKYPSLEVSLDTVLGLGIRGTRRQEVSLGDHRADLIADPPSRLRSAMSDMNFIEGMSGFNNLGACQYENGKEKKTRFSRLCFNCVIAFCQPVGQRQISRWWHLGDRENLNTTDPVASCRGLARFVLVTGLSRYADVGVVSTGRVSLQLTNHNIITT